MKAYFKLMMVLLLVQQAAYGQKVEQLYFNLYTDSLKKGIHNYINVDGKLSDGSFTPLDTKQIKLSSNYGKWEGNSLIIDSAYQKDSVVVTVLLIANPALTRSITIYMKKNTTEPPLKTEKELLDELRKKKKG
jgi:hypothetical protein